MRKLVFLLLLFCWLPPILIAQPQFITSLYPPQHGLNIPADAELHVSLQSELDPVSLADSAIYIYADITGLHKWQATLENGGKDLRLRPKHWWGIGDVPFNAGERVTVTLNKRLRYADGRPFEGFTWHYTVAVRPNHGGTFTSLVVFGGATLRGFYVADLNGDRYPDFAAHDSFQKKLVIFMNDGQGKLTSYFFAPGWGAGGSFQSFDFDHNGGIDIGIGMRIIQFNDGKANFTPREILPIGTQGYRLYDFNNDGIFDLVGNVPHPNHGIKISLSSDGKAFVDTQSVSVPFLPPFNFPGETYDVDNDGRIDLVATGYSVPDNSFYGFARIKMKDRTPLEVFQLENNQISTSLIYANDLTGDGFIDYSFIGSRVPSEAGTYLTHFNDGQGRLQPAGVHIDSLNALYSAGGGDVDSDGDIDFFVTKARGVSVMPERYINTHTVVLNRGNGVFDWQAWQPLPYDQAYGPPARLVDLDLDGDLDVIQQGPFIFMVLANGAYATSVKNSSTSPPRTSKLRIWNTPNPFNTITTFHISISQPFQEACLRIFDLSGRVVKQWVLHHTVTGDLTVKWDGRDENQQQVSNGIYLVQLQTGRETNATKTIVMR